jgi:hypothetical protein
MVPNGFTDLLRSQLVYSVSAFDKLIHDLVRVGMVQTFQGTRTATRRYHDEEISLQLHGLLISATLPPAEVLFEQAITRKLRKMSFQDPDKVAEGLSLIWGETHKWSAIAAKMGVSPDVARKTMKLIANRRNAIVHESDTDPVTHVRNSISKQETSEVTDFLERCGIAIVALLI